MSTLNAYYRNVSEIHPSYKWWIAKTKTEMPSGLMIGYEGKVEISGLPSPKNKEFSPISKIFSSVRRRYFEETKLSVTGLFYKNTGVIYGSFLPNYAMCDDDLREIDKVNTDFVKLFDRLSILLEEAIDAWLLDPDNGFSAYCQYVESCEEGEVDYDVCNQMFDRYLRAANIKTEADEKEKIRRKKAAKSAL